MVEKFKEILGIKQKDQNPQMMINSSKGITAKSAYMRSKYGQDTTQIELLKKFFTDVNNLISAKSMDGSYCCMIEVDKDIKEFIPEIIERFQNKLGYTLVVLDKDTVITNKITGDNKDFSIPTESTFIIIMWGNASISDSKED